MTHKEAKEQEMQDEPTNDAQNEEQQEDVLDLLKRTQANFENYRKQSGKRLEEQQKFANERLIKELLPTLDTFEMALKSADQDPTMVVEGVKMIHKQLLSVLANHGVKQVEPKGKFNPAEHEAIAKVDSDKEPDTIVEVVQKGYHLHNKLLRAARVKISGKPNSQEETK